ncbi:Carbon-nitrogen hydrolase [Lithohypha guttulata]|uniref:Carbon-nitrogen hydrolase n=1 Tax=Lithohypha guttulata TaxID=1690604 RepID=A0AAN7YE10_9EURO|nr:Carbon-nitrogen hydrolase [Lithohypha guttulata]
MSHNLAQCQKLVKKAADAGAKALFLPEGSDYIGSGPEESVSLAKTIHESEFVRGLQDEARQHKISIQVGLHEPTNPPSSRILNTLLWISPSGKILEETRYTKLHLFNLDLGESGGPVMKENKTIQAGNTIVEPYSTVLGKVGSQICFDLRFPEPAIRLRRLGANIIVYPSAFTVPTGALGHWEILLRARAIETECYIVAAAQCGRHNEKRVSYGDSMVIDPKGRVVTRASKVEDEKSEKEGARDPQLLTFEIDTEAVDDARKTIPLERRTDVYPEI